MELQQLRFFVVVSEQGSISAAASVLQASPATISEALQTLERKLGTPLFYRLGTGMALTSAGYAMLGTARRLTRLAAATPEAIRQDGGAAAARLTVCLIDNSASGAGPRCIASFLRQSSRASVVTTRAANATDAADLVKSGMADVAIVVVGRTAAQANDLSSLVLDTETVLAVHPPGTVVPAEGLTLEDLSERPLVLSSSSSDIYPALAEHFSLLGSPRRVPLRASRREDRLSLVAAGLGSSFITDRDRARAEHIGAVVCPLNPVLERDVHLLWAEDRESGVTQDFVEVCRAEAETNLAARTKA
ncbi:LysR family transcriptional regulator (plasmid) [Rhodococcus pyridinivorans]|uniref:LysR family transcriptional regulator n=1 Tax=Rhodococcus TaxID=1827 RepID=UPI0007D8F828|nr:MULTISPECIES: LysR family transcriptional regulator [Rhodococcus]MCT7293657.1 LysR family transcriptional regulator [Rhodococcus sp. PAE-6]QXU56440.1 LysR family transcriptional regulator [Rhodococcus sp. LW-XY12]UQB75810.1 LysR family transcriptional regulator [Rhodococcus ruber]UVT27498.1 LysR family transcriptional regulator [Rhodococcus pyridinivorans]WML66339.1 LysR family transcriptional regulator [Rhodococcus sp. AH-ZY2]